MHRHAPRSAALTSTLAFLSLIFAWPDMLRADKEKDAALGEFRPRGTRRVIYNSDLSNTTSHMSDPAKSEELREIVRKYAREGAIDTVVQEIWHQGWSTFWRSEHCEYDSRPQHRRLVPMMESGVMPIDVYIDECHKQKMEFLAGFRMNDRHGHNPDLFEKIGREHPEWILGFKPTSRGADPRSRKLGCSLDYAQAGVRDWLFSIMKEVATRFDVDGLEFNFTRMPEIFRSDVADDNHPIMTAFMRRIRAMLDEAGKQKGRRLLLGVRVLQSIEGCRKVGLDVPTWIRDGSVDYVAPADIGFTDFNARYEEFVRIARKHNCFVYPQLEYRLSYPRRREPPQTAAHSRAALRNFYAAGADGFSTQNFHGHWGPELIHYPKAFNLLKELRDPERVAAGDRHYVFTPLWGRSGPGANGPSDTYQPEVIRLSRDKLGQRGALRFRLCEHLTNKAAVTFKPSIARGDEIALEVNGTPIPANDITYDWPEEPGASPVGRFALTSPPAVYGDNQLGVRLLKSDPKAKEDVTLFEVEVIVKAKSEAGTDLTPAVLSESHLAAVNRTRRIYVNNDAGYDKVAMGPKETLIKPDEWLAARFSAFDQPGSQVDCVGWCLDEGNIAAYPSDVIPELQYPTLLRWRKNGVDIAQRIVEESRRRKLEVFWEHRLNGADREADVSTPARHPLKDQHPDWLIKESWWKPGLWNFAVPEVREYKVAVLREVAERYDLDGLNLDFGRHPPFLPPGKQWEQRDALTDFVRQVRLMLQKVAHRRGRPFLLSVRVADTVPGCHFDGMDIETWVRQNLVDMIVIGTRSIEVDLTGFRRITAGTHVKLYPCIDQHHSPDGYHAVTSPQFLRGLAANWWHQGADGIATFNFWNELPDSAKVIGSSGPMSGDRSVHAIAYREIGDPKTLRPLDKWFVVSRRYGGGFYDRFGKRWNHYTNLNHQAQLPLAIGNDPAWVEVYVADATAARPRELDQLELRLQISGRPDPRTFRVKFNGVQLAEPQIEGEWWTLALNAKMLAVGRNLVALDGRESVSKREKVSIEKVEVYVKYQPAKTPE